MPLNQILAFAVLGGAVAMFAWGRFRYDLVALSALLVGILLKIVPAKAAFTGFTSDVVVIIACALVVSAAIARSGVMEMVLRPALNRMKSAATLTPFMAGATGLLSMPTKNVGALAILMPLALRRARRTETAPSSILMPMAFMSLLGGLVTLVGTSTNIIVSQVRQELIGKPFQMFDFAPVGLVLTAIGFLFVSVGWRLLPRDRKGQAGMGEAVAGAAPYSTEAQIAEDEAQREDGPRTLADLKLGQDDVRLAALIRGGERRAKPLPDSTLASGDILVLEGEQESLMSVIERLGLVSTRTAPGDQIEKESASEEMRAVEGVVQPGSLLIGLSAKRVQLQQQFGVNLLAVGRSGERITERLREVSLRAGDILVLQAGEKALPSALSTLGVLPLAERDVQLGSRRARWLPTVILTIAMVLLALKMLPVAVAFFAAAVVVVATGGISMREAYDSLDGQVLVLIGALTPLSEAVRETGGTELIAHFLAGWLHMVPPLVALGVLLVTSMACSPFLHNAPTVLVLAPVAVTMSHKLGLNADPFLMAVAVGSGCDFLTPIGHQSNTLVMGPGGYRFGDYWRLGAPLSLLVILLGTPLIAVFWPLAGR